MSENKIYDKKIIQIRKILERYSLEDKAVFYKDVSKLTSIRAGGRCVCFLVIDDRHILAPVLEDFLKSNIRFYLIGEGTNILFADGLIDIILLKLGKDFNYIDFGNGNEITVGAAYNLHKFITQAAEAGIDFSFLSGIPGTVGGAVFGNSGTKKENICEYVKKVKYISINGKKIQEKEKKLLKKDYSYRYFNTSCLAILTDIYLEGKFLDQNLIIKKISEIKKSRKENQPVKSKNSGCFFKNPRTVELSAGEIIDKCRFKGFIYGGARVSDIHSNFIENFNNASSKDIFTLVKIIKESVRERFNVNLEYEVRMVGFE